MGDKFTKQTFRASDREVVTVELVVAKTPENALSKLQEGQKYEAALTAVFTTASCSVPTFPHAFQSTAWLG